MKTISTIEEALEYITTAQGKGVADDFTLSGELATLRITIDGEKYHSSVPTELARGLWQLQEQLYGAVAHILRGSADIRKLTAEDRDAFELVFEVRNGCSELVANVGKFFEKLGEGLSNMDDTNKRKALVAIAVLVALGYIGGKVADDVAGVKKEQITGTQAIGLEKERTKQLEEITKAMREQPAVLQMRDAFSEGGRAVVRSASDAKEIKIGHTHLYGDDIQEVTRRAPRTQTVPDVINMEFRIFKVDVRNEGEMKYVLAGQGTGEFIARIDESQFTTAELSAMLNAAQERRHIRLEVLLLRSNGAIKSAQILQVLD
jgi:hypothetical protein